MYRFSREQKKYHKKKNVEIQFFEENEALRETEEITLEGGSTEEIVKAYWYEKYTLPWREEFSQEAEYDEEGNLVSQDYVEENYSILLEESKGLELSQAKTKKRSELKVIRDKHRAQMPEINGHLQSIEREDTHDALAKLEVAKSQGAALWKHGDNDVGMRDNEYMTNLTTEMNRLVDNHFKVEGIIGFEIDNCNTLKELNTIDLESRFKSEYEKTKAV